MCSLRAGRFGAEALFKENESEVADKSKALYEDSIDAILARAEVSPPPRPPPPCHRAVVPACRNTKVTTLKE